jgi:hypothetical protein
MWAKQGILRQNRKENFYDKNTFHLPRQQKLRLLKFFDFTMITAK